jgi:hypothetical protein
LIPWLARYVAAAALGEYLGQQAPSPAYLGVHVGLGLMLLCGLLAVDMRPALRRWLAIPAALGRASLAVFIAKYFFCFTMLEWWKRGLLALLAPAAHGIADRRGRLRTPLGPLREQQCLRRRPSLARHPARWTPASSR